EGDKVRLYISDPVIARVNLALTKMWTEWDHLKGFVRFSDLDGVLVGEIEPKNRVLPLLAPHFAARYSGERLALYDRTHHEIFLSDRGRWKLLPAEEFRMGPAGVEERAYRAMWRKYYDTIAIEGRINPKCQSTHLPKRYRHVMTEFLTDEEMERSLPERAPAGSLEGGNQTQRSTSTTRT
ncbi:MAG: TIGR03915 family putative DNA repair protein, partial [Oscillospiraceae bacterium]